MGKKMVAGVDVGSSKICCLLANVDNEGSIQVVGMGTCPSRGIQKGLVSDLDQSSQAIREAVAKAEQTSGEHIVSVYLGIPGGSMSSQDNRGIVAVGRSARPVSQRDVRRALTAARQFDLPAERRLLHMIPTQYTLDGQVGVKDPVGMHGFRLDVDTHIVTISQGAAENVIKCVHKAGLKIEGLVLQCLASAQSVLYPDEIDAGVVLADIGAGTTGISAYKNGNLELTAVLPVGGNQITRDLAIGLGMPFAIAEKLKKNQCDLSERLADDSEDTDESPVTVNLDGAGKIKIMKRDVNDIVRARVVEIMKLVISQLPGNRAYIPEFPAGLVLTGGTANLAGIGAVAQEITGLPTRIGIPRGMSGLADVLYNPAYASSVGVVLHGGRWPREQSWVKEGPLERFKDRVRSVKQLVPRFNVSTSA